MMHRPVCLGLAICLAGVVAQAQEREWSLDVTDQDAFLVFGTPNTDDVGLSLWCKQGSGMIKLFMEARTVSSKKGASETLQVTAGKSSHRVVAIVGANEQDGVLTLEAELAARSPVINALQQTDYFTITVAGHNLSFPLMEASLPQLVKLCE